MLLSREFQESSQGYQMHTFAGVQEKLPLSHPGLGTALPTLTLRMPGNAQSMLSPTALRTQTGGLRGTRSPQLCITNVPKFY